MSDLNCDFAEVNLSNSIQASIPVRSKQKTASTDLFIIPSRPDAAVLTCRQNQPINDDSETESSCSRETTYSSSPTATSVNATRVDTEDEHSAAGAVVSGGCGDVPQAPPPIHGQHTPPIHAQPIPLNNSNATPIINSNATPLNNSNATPIIRALPPPLSNGDEPEHSPVTSTPLRSPAEEEDDKHDVYMKHNTTNNDNDDDDEDDDLLNELTAELTIDHDGDNKDKGGGDELDEQLNDTAAIDQGGVTGRGGTNDYDTRYAETKVTLTVALDNMKSLQMEYDAYVQRDNKLSCERLQLAEETNTKIIQLEASLSRCLLDLKESHLTLSKHDDAAKRTIDALKSKHDQLQTQLSQLNELVRLIGQEKDSMVVKYATAEQSCIRLQNMLSRSDSVARELAKEKDLASTRLRTTLHEKQKALDRIDVKNCEISKMRKEVESLKNHLKTAVNDGTHFKEEKKVNKELKCELDKINQKLKTSKAETLEASETIKAQNINYALKATDDKMEYLEKLLSEEKTISEVNVANSKTAEAKLAECVLERDIYRDRITCYEQDREAQMKTFQSYQATLQMQKNTFVELTADKEALENALQREKEEFQQCTEDLSRANNDVAELKDDNSALNFREKGHLTFKSNIAVKNAELQSLNSTQSTIIKDLEADGKELLEKNKKLMNALNDIKIKSDDDKCTSDLDISKLNLVYEELKSTVQHLRIQLEDEKDKFVSMQRKNNANLKDLTKQLKYMKNTGDNDSINTCSRSNSICSLDTNNDHHHSPQDNELSPRITIRECDTALLYEKIIKLQRLLAKKCEKIDFLNDHTGRLVKELQKKSKLLHHYVLREEAGTLTSFSIDDLKKKYMEKEKKMLMKTHGGILSSVFTSQSSDMSLEISVDITNRLQAVIEELLLKNITLKENIETLGIEIARISKYRTNEID